MTDDFVARRHAEIDAEVRFNDGEAELAFNTLSRCHHRVADLPVTVKAALEAIARLRRGPGDGASWTVEDMAALLHDGAAGSWSGDVARARVALDQLEAALRPWQAR